MQPSWEKKMLEDQQETNALLDEIGYSEGQRRLDEMVFGEEAFEHRSARRPLPGGRVGLLGSPYRTGFGGHIYAFFYYALGLLALALVAAVIHTCAHWGGAQGPTGRPAASGAASPPPAASTP
jgi:hypothetical protein